MSHVHAFSCICIFNSLYSDILSCWCFSDCLSLSPSISLSCVSCSWHPNANLLHPRTLFLGHLLPLILHLLLFNSVMRKLIRTSRRTSLDEAFIRNDKSFCLISLTLHFPQSSTVGVVSHFVVPWSLVLP